MYVLNGPGTAKQTQQTAAAVPEEGVFDSEVIQLHFLQHLIDEQKY